MTPRLTILLLLSIAVGCGTAASGRGTADEVVGAWVRLERGDPVVVAEQIAIALGKPEATNRERPGVGPRAEIDSVTKALRWRGGAADAERSLVLVPQFDVAHEQDLAAELHSVSVSFACGSEDPTKVCADIGDTFRMFAYLMDGSCRSLEVFECVPDPANQMIWVRGELHCMRFLCKWLSEKGR